MVASDSKARKGAAAAEGRSASGRAAAAEGRSASGRAAAPASERATRTPLPGQPVRGSTTGRPVMALLDLLGRRWTLRVMWELRNGDRLTFRELQARCGEISSSVLNDRLRELREAQIVMAQAPGGYRLSDDGRELLRALEPIDAWATGWAKRTARARRR
jgi:DNA-binding HxlR family transcriptional regulator